MGLRCAGVCRNRDEFDVEPFGFGDAFGRRVGAEIVLDEVDAAAVHGWVQLGAAGTTGSSSRSATWSATFSTKVKASIMDSIVEVSVSLGESHTCSNGSEFDSELILSADKTWPI